MIIAKLSETVAFVLPKVTARTTDTTTRIRTTAADEPKITGRRGDRHGDDTTHLIASSFSLRPGRR